MREHLLAEVSATATEHLAHDPMPHRRYYSPLALDVAKARQDLIGKLHLWGLGDRADDAALVLSELFTNAVRYARFPPPGRLRVDAEVVTDGTWHHLRIAVTDPDRESIDRVRQPADGEIEREGGMGLLVVEMISERWGVDTSEVGKTVWCDLDLAAHHA